MMKIAKALMCLTFFMTSCSGVGAQKEELKSLSFQASGVKQITADDLKRNIFNNKTLYDIIKDSLDVIDFSSFTQEPVTSVEDALNCTYYYAKAKVLDALKDAHFYIKSESSNFTLTVQTGDTSFDMPMTLSYESDLYDIYDLGSVPTDPSGSITVNYSSKGSIDGITNFEIKKDLQIFLPETSLITVSLVDKNDSNNIITNLDYFTIYDLFFEAEGK